VRSLSLAVAQFHEITLHFYDLCKKQAHEMVPYQIIMMIDAIKLDIYRARSE